MALRDQRPEEVAKLSPEEQTAWFREWVEDWPAFVEGILESEAEWIAHRAAGKPGLPPGWISFRDFLREHPL